MVERLLSFWDAILSSAMLFSGSVFYPWYKVWKWGFGSDPFFKSSQKAANFRPIFRFANLRKLSFRQWPYAVLCLFLPTFVSLFVETFSLPRPCDSGWILDKMLLPQISLAWKFHLGGSDGSGCFSLGEQGWLLTTYMSWDDPRSMVDGRNPAAVEIYETLCIYLDLFFSVMFVPWGFITIKPPFGTFSYFFQAF